jgi:hypothetical protein
MKRNAFVNVKMKPFWREILSNCIDKGIILRDLKIYNFFEIVGNPNPLRMPAMQKGY